MNHTYLKPVLAVGLALFTISAFLSIGKAAGDPNPTLAAQTVAGSGVAGHEDSSDARGATFVSPKAIDIDPQSIRAGAALDIFVTDSGSPAAWNSNVEVDPGTGSRIRRIEVGGSVSTVAGRDAPPGLPSLGVPSGDPPRYWPAKESYVLGPWSVAFNHNRAVNGTLVDDNLYVVMNQLVVQVPRAPGEKVTGEENAKKVVGGSTGDVGPGPAKFELRFARSVAFDKSGGMLIATRYHIYRADPGSNGTFDGANENQEPIDPEEIITRVAGPALGGGRLTPDGNGVPATASMLAYPHGISFDRAGNLLIADTGNHRIRKVTPGLDGVITGAPDEIISTVAGSGPGGNDNSGYPNGGFSGDHGPATEARLDTPRSVVEDAAGNLLITDFHNNRIRRISPGPDGQVNGNNPRGPGDGPAQEIIDTVAGCGPARNQANAPACASGQVPLNGPYGLALGPCPEADAFVSEWFGNRILQFKGLAACGKVDLSILSFVSDPPEGTVGSPLSLRIVARNEGPQAASGVKISVSNDAPFVASFGSPSMDKEGTCDFVAGTGFTCILATPLDPGETATISFEATPISGGTLLSTASVRSETPLEEGATLGDNQRQLSIPVKLLVSVPQDGCLVGCGSGGGSTDGSPPPGSTPPGASPVDPNQSSLSVTAPPGGPGSAAPSTVPVSSSASQPFGQQVPLTGSLGFQTGPASAIAPASAPTVPEWVGAGAPAAAASALADASDEQQSKPAPRYSMVSHETALQTGVSLTGAVFLAGLACMAGVWWPPSRAAPAAGWGSGSRASSPRTRRAV